MKSQITWRGFTLIEILVVVLIIAVLATIAVSAYQKAVLKSRFSSLMPLAKTLAQGNEEYYLRNGQYTNDASKLDIKAAGNSKTQITLSDEEQHKYVLLTRDDMNNQLRMYQQKSKNFPGETHCEALINDSLANWLCEEGLNGNFRGNKYGYAVYSLNPESVGTLARIEYNGPGNVTDGDVCVGTVDCGCGCSGNLKRTDSFCFGENRNACNNGTYVRSICVANSGGACQNAAFTDHSFCFANGGGCNLSSSFDETSCCVGGSKCPSEESTCEYKGITPPAQPTY